MKRHKNLTWFIGNTGDKSARLIFDADDDVSIRSWKQLRDWINKTIAYRRTVKATKIKLLKCDDCGTVSREVSATYCPYAAEVNGDQVDMNLCHLCQSERADDI